MSGRDVFALDRLLEGIGWWMWRRWRIYCPKHAPEMESPKSVVARLNKRSWPCSDKPLFFPPMVMDKREDA